MESGENEELRDRLVSLPFNRLQYICSARQLDKEMAGGLSSTQRLEAKERMVTGIINWMSLWPDAKDPPELTALTSEEALINEARDLGVEESLVVLTGSEKERKSQKTTLVRAMTRIHIRLREEAIESAEDDRSEVTDDEDDQVPLFSHPHGIAGTGGAGKSRDFYPLGYQVIQAASGSSEPPEKVPVPLSDSDREALGTVVVVVRSFLDQRLVLPKGVVREQFAEEIGGEFRFVSGLIQVATRENSGLELFSRLHYTTSAMDPEVLEEMPEFDSWKELMAAAEVAIHSDSSPHPVSFWGRLKVKIDLDDARQVHTELPVLMSKEGVDLTVATPMRPADDPPPSDEPEAKDPSNRAEFLSMSAEEQKSALIETLKSCMAGPVDGLKALAEKQARKVLPIGKVGNVNPVSGEPFDAKDDAAKKLQKALEEASKPRNILHTGNICAMCTASNFRRNKEEGEVFTDAETRQKYYVYTPGPKAKICSNFHGETGLAGTTPAHPNPMFPSACPSCYAPVFCDGKFMSGCQSCQAGWMFPSVDRRPSRPEDVKASREKVAEKWHQYARAYMGDNSWLGPLVSLHDSRRALVARLRNLPKGFFRFPITGRILHYLPLLQFSKSPSGEGGLCIRDTFPRSQEEIRELFSNLEETSAEKMTREVGMDQKEQEKWIKTNESTAPAWPVFQGVGAETLLAAAVEGMHQLLALLGDTIKMDSRQWATDINALNSGADGNELMMVEHKACLSLYEFHTRMVQQAECYSECSLWDHEKKSGPFVRLALVENSHMFLSEIYIPLQMKEYEERVLKFYSNRFNGGGTGLSGAKNGNKKKVDFKKPEAKEQKIPAPKPQGTGESGQDTGPPADALVGEYEQQFLNSVVQPLPGLKCGERYSQAEGCRTGGVKCPLSHTRVTRWSAGALIMDVRQYGAGTGDFFITGNGDDYGEEIPLLDGVMLKQRCLVTAFAGGAFRQMGGYEHKPGGSPACLLAYEINSALLEAAHRGDIDVNSRLAEIVVTSGHPDFQGYDERILDAVRLASLDRHNLVVISEGRITDPEDRSGLGISIYPAGSTIKTPKLSWAYSYSEKGRKLAAKEFAEWSLGSQAESAPTVVVLSSFNHDGPDSKKHCRSFRLPKKLASLKSLIQCVARGIEFGERNFEARMLTRGDQDYLNSEKVEHSLATAELLREATQAIEKEHKLLEKGIDWEYIKHFQTEREIEELKQSRLEAKMPRPKSDIPAPSRRAKTKASSHEKQARTNYQPVVATSPESQEEPWLELPEEEYPLLEDDDAEPTQLKSSVKSSASLGPPLPRPRTKADEVQDKADSKVVGCSFRKLHPIKEARQTKSDTTAEPLTPSPLSGTRASSLNKVKLSSMCLCADGCVHSASGLPANDQAAKSTKESPPSTVEEPTLPTPRKIYAPFRSQTSGSSIRTGGSCSYEEHAKEMIEGGKRDTAKTQHQAIKASVVPDRVSTEKVNTQVSAHITQKAKQDEARRVADDKRKAREAAKGEQKAAARKKRAREDDKAIAAAMSIEKKKAGQKQAAQVRKDEHAEASAQKQKSNLRQELDQKEKADKEAKLKGSKLLKSARATLAVSKRTPKSNTNQRRDLEAKVLQLLDKREALCLQPDTNSKEVAGIRANLAAEAAAHNKERKADEVTADARDTKGDAAKFRGGTPSEEKKDARGEELSKHARTKESKEDQASESLKKCKECIAYLRDAEVDVSDPKSVRNVLLTLAKKTDEWFRVEASSPWRCQLLELPVVARMAMVLRHTLWGAGRVTKDVDLCNLSQDEWDAIPEGHQDALQELMHTGCDSGYIGPKAGYYGRDDEEDELALQQMDLSTLDLCKAGQMLVFTGAEDVLKELVESNLSKEGKGVRLAPSQGVPKYDERKQERTDPRTGHPLKRIVQDFTDGGDPAAKNSGTYSALTSKQLGTDAACLASAIIAEEKRHPDRAVQLSHCDLEKAYNKIPLAPRDIGTQASRTNGLVTVSLVHGFGGRDASGRFEEMGSAPTKAIKGSTWKNPERNGATIPGNVRCADDLLIPAARAGDRQLQATAQYRGLIKLIGGQDAINADKLEISGQYGNYQIAFGNLVDVHRRQIGNPGSRLSRLESKLLPFLEDDSAKLDFKWLNELAGTLQPILSRVTGLTKMVMPRLNKMKSNAHAECGCMPSPTHVPSAKIGEETEEQGQATLRTLLSLTWRLLTIEEGKYAGKQLEEFLPRPCREAIPGEQDHQLFVESDASLEGTAYFDPELGGYAQVWYSEEEKEKAIGVFQREDGGEPVIISNLEYLGPVIGLMLSMLHHPYKKFVSASMDNQAVVAALNGGRVTNQNDLECSILIGIIEYITGMDIGGYYTASEDNVRMDPASRPDLQTLFQEEMNKWEQESGTTAWEIQVPAFLRDMSSWVNVNSKASPVDRIKSVIDKLSSWLQWLQATPCKLPSKGKAAGEEMLSDRLRVPAGLVLDIIGDIRAGAKLPRIDQSKPDFPSQEEESTGRKLLCPKSGKVHKETRTSLLKKISRGKQSIAQAAQKAGVKVCQDPEFGVHNTIDDILQAQHDLKEVIWEPSLAESGNSRSREKEVPPTPCFELEDDKVRMAEHNAGQGSFSKAAVDSGGGEITFMAECVSFLNAHLKNRFPPPTVVERLNEHISLKMLEESKTECIMGGTACQSHSEGNRSRKGNLEPEGQTYQSQGDVISAAFGGFGLAFAIEENVKGVLHSTEGHKSPYEELFARLPGFHDGLKKNGVIQSWTTASPLTGLPPPPIHRERCFSIPLNDKCFPKNAEIKIPAAEPSGSFERHVVNDSSTPGRYKLPKGDYIDFNWKERRSQGVHYLGTIDQPPSGHGEGAFPPTGWDPAKGRGVTLTSVGGKWMCKNYNGEATFVQVLPEEYFQAHQLRGFTPTELERLLDPKKAIGLEVIANSVVQSDADAVVVNTLKLYTDLMSVEDSKEKGFAFRVSPRDVFRWHTMAIVPPGLEHITPGTAEARLPRRWSPPNTSPPGKVKSAQTAGNGDKSPVVRRIGSRRRAPVHYNGVGCCPLTRSQCETKRCSCVASTSPHEPRASEEDELVAPAKTNKSSEEVVQEIMRDQAVMAAVMAEDLVPEEEEESEEEEKGAQTDTEALACLVSTATEEDKRAQKCKQCNKKWTCMKSPPEAHELCKECEQAESARKAQEPTGQKATEPSCTFIIVENTAEAHVMQRHLDFLQQSAEVHALPELAFVSSMNVPKKDRLGGVHVNHTNPNQVWCSAEKRWCNRDNWEDGFWDEVNGKVRSCCSECLRAAKRRVQIKRLVSKSTFYHHYEDDGEGGAKRPARTKKSARKGTTKAPRQDKKDSLSQVQSAVGPPQLSQQDKAAASAGSEAEEQQAPAVPAPGPVGPLKLGIGKRQSEGRAQRLRQAAKKQKKVSTTAEASREGSGHMDSISANQKPRPAVQEGKGEVRCASCNFTLTNTSHLTGVTVLCTACHREEQARALRSAKDAKAPCAPKKKAPWLASVSTKYAPATQPRPSAEPANKRDSPERSVPQRPAHLKAEKDNKRTVSRTAELHALAAMCTQHAIEAVSEEQRGKVNSLVLEAELLKAIDQAYDRGTRDYCEEFKLDSEVEKLS